MIPIHTSPSDSSSASSDNPFIDYALPDWASGSSGTQGVPSAPQVCAPVDAFCVGGSEGHSFSEIDPPSGDSASGSLDFGDTDPLTGTSGASGVGFEDGRSGLPPVSDAFEGVPSVTSMAFGEESTAVIHFCWLPPFEPLPVPFEEIETFQDPLTGTVDPWFPDWTDINSGEVVDGEPWVDQPPWIDEDTWISVEEPPADSSDPFVSDPFGSVDFGSDFTETIDFGAPTEEGFYNFGGRCPDPSDGSVTLEEPFADSLSGNTDFVDIVIEDQDTSYSEPSSQTFYPIYAYVDCYVEPAISEIMSIEAVFNPPEGISSDPSLEEQPLNLEPSDILDSTSEKPAPLDPVGLPDLSDPVPIVPESVFTDPIDSIPLLSDLLTEESGGVDPFDGSTSSVPIKEPFPISEDFVITTMALGEEGGSGCWPPLEIPIEFDPESPFSYNYPGDEVGFDLTVDPFQTQPNETDDDTELIKPLPVELDGVTSDPTGLWGDTSDGSQQLETSIDEHNHETVQIFTETDLPQLIYFQMECLPNPPLDDYLYESNLLDSVDIFEALPPNSDPVGLSEGDHSINLDSSEGGPEPLIVESEPEGVYLDAVLGSDSTSTLFDNDFSLSELVPVGRPHGLILPWYRTSVVTAPRLPSDPVSPDLVVGSSVSSDSVVPSADGLSQDSTDPFLGTPIGASIQGQSDASVAESSFEEPINEPSDASTASSSASIEAAPVATSAEAAPDAAATEASPVAVSTSSTAAATVTPLEALSVSTAGSSRTATQSDAPLSPLPQERSSQDFSSLTSLERSSQDLPSIALASPPIPADVITASAAASASSAEISPLDTGNPQIDNSVFRLLLDSDGVTPIPLDDFQLSLLTPSS